MNKRTYGQNCALARATDLIGERWTLLLLRDLMVSPRRFKDLQASLKGMGSNLLSARLKDLAAADIVEKRSGAGAPTYCLTERGWALESTLLSLIRWGLRYGPENKAGDHHRDDWDLLALKSLFIESRARGLDVTVQFDSPGLTAWVRISQQQMTVGLGAADAPDLKIHGTVANVFIDNDHPEALLASGDEETLRKFLSVFALR